MDQTFDEQNEWTHDMSALRGHYQGEGNTKKRIAEDERLNDSLHYRNDRGLPFAFYLSKMQKMLTLFEENKEPYSDAMKLLFLYETIKHPQLMTTVSTLQEHKTLQDRKSVVSYAESA